MKFRDLYSYTILLSSVLFFAKSYGKPSEIDRKHWAQKNLYDLCHQVRNIRHLSMMQDLIDALKDALRDKDFARFQIEHSSGVFCHDCWKFAISYGEGSLQQCVFQADAITDLEPLVKERENVCKSSHMDLIESYKDKHLKKHSNPKPITYNFFYLYAAQVSILCKKNLLHSLTLANRGLAHDSYAKMTQWLSHIGSCSTKASSKVPKSFDFGIQNDERTRCCAAIKLLSEVRSIDELAILVDRDKKLSQDSNRAKQVSTNEQPGQINSLSSIPDSILDSLEEMRGICFELRPIYTNTIIPIVRLAKMGIDPEYREFEVKCHSEEIIQRWFMITLVCNTMLSCRLASNVNLDPPSGPLFNDPSRQRDLINSSVDASRVVEDRVASEHQSRDLPPPDYAMNPMEDELWIGKYLPSRLDKLKSDTVKKVVRTFRLDSLSENAAFRKSLKYGQNVVIGLTLISLTLAGMDSSLLSV